MVTSEAHDQLVRNADELLAAGKMADAIGCLKHALAARPNAFRTWLKLAKALHEAGDHAGAIQAGQTAEQKDPLQAEFVQVQQHVQAGRFSQARAEANAMLTKEPGHPRAVFTLAHLAQARGDGENAVKALEYGLGFSPANIMLKTMLVSALENIGRYGGAIETAQSLVATQETFDTLWTLITVLLRYGQNEAALEACARAAPLAVDDPLKQSEIALVRGQVLRILGQPGASVAAFHACLDHNASNAAAWWGLADMKTYSFTDADKQALHTLLNDEQTRSEQKSLASFALAKAHESAGDWPKAMVLYTQANAVRPSNRFDPRQFGAAVDRVTGALSSPALSQQAEPPPDGPIPIFIVGLPRSGSTLVEQILASHSQIEGTMEQPVLPAVKSRAHALCRSSFGMDYLEGVGELSPSMLTELGQAYLDEGRVFRTDGSPYFTDKLPFNFEHVGLIHKILPQALIIDARRHPMDCGLSLYKQHFARGSEFSSDLSHIGAYYNGYLKMMDHWDAVLPGRVLRVQYEDLIQSPEQVIHRMLDHIGIPFQEACLNFHETQRAVRTASSEQVRQPLYTGSIGLWRRVEPQLQALKDSLGAATLERFKAYL
ncbi:MAG: sulfotransferase [Pseudomonadota bacterium]